uniref:Uncharacterized protein n=1 Tax=Melopsittacus undulatus TaxID=13146 RepID=A0A8V5FYC5_MELUD
SAMGEHRMGPCTPLLSRCHGADALELRLVEGSGPCAGKVEVKLRGLWGVVEDDTWTMEDAEVICQQLGCGSATKAYIGSSYEGSDDRPVNMVMVNCRGHEKAFWECKVGDWGPYSTSHYLDIGVVCQGFSRLVGGDGRCSGLLEVRQGRAWAGVCEDAVDLNTARVVCRELGCGSVLTVAGPGLFPMGSEPRWDTGFECTGTELLLSACKRRARSTQGCRSQASIICSSYDGFRLVNHSSHCAGRVEVMEGGTWGSLCASAWDLPDAHVLCHHLGCGSASSVPPGGSFGSGNGTLRVDAFGCSGTERVPSECPVVGLGEPSCPPGHAAAVECSGSSPGASRPCPAGSRRLRLAGGPDRCAGRVELYVNGAWSPVCQDGWDIPDATVVCRQLRCGAALEASGSAHFGPGAAPPWTGAGGCTGSEASLWDCPAPLESGCRRGGGAAAVCSGHLSLRLTGGSGRCRGHLELLHNGTWGRVCADGTSPATAAAACRQLGCGDWGILGAAPAPLPAPAWLAWVRCPDGARSLWLCPSAPWRLQPCAPGGDAHVVCAEDGGSHELRLVGGGGRCAGRVEVKHEGEWGSVCSYDFDWGAHWATVVCRQLGCGTAATSSPYAPFGQGTGRIWLHIFFCRGKEEMLQDCSHLGWGQHYCGHQYDVGVTCTGFSRLVGGDGRCSGLLEVRQGRAWTSVCEDAVDLNAAQVVCRELGCGSVLAVAGPGLFPMGSEPQWDTGFECTGTELLLSACKRRARSTQGCSAQASIICSSYDGFRLVNHSSHCAGRVEVMEGGTWGSLCASAWDLPDAHVLCHHLGCGSASSVPPGGSFGSGNGTLRVDAFGCSGTERVPSECPVVGLGEPSCPPGHAAAVQCAGSEDALAQCNRSVTAVAPRQALAVVCSGECSRRLRLAGGPDRCAGRVELYVNGAWSPVCQDGWDIPDATVVCRQLRCGAALEASGSARFGPGAAPPWTGAGGCTGSEASLWDCPAPLESGCRSGGGAGAVCSGHLSLRLTGGSGRCRGHLELLHNGTWGRVCADGTSPATAAAACRQLGCGDGGSLGAAPAPLPAPAWLAWVRCPDGARSLWLCPSAPWRLQPCAPGGDAHVVWLGSCITTQGSHELRLVGGDGRCAGRVEVKHEGEWGSVCSYDFDWSAHWATVVCRQLGCGTAATSSPYAPFGQGTGRIWLHIYFCRGQEEMLQDCSHLGWGQHYCGHEQDVGVTCTGEPGEAGGAGTAAMCRSNAGDGTAQSPGWGWKELKAPPAPTPSTGAAAPSPCVQPGLEHCQGWGSHSFSGHPVPAPQHPPREQLLPQSSAQSPLSWAGSSHSPWPVPTSLVPSPSPVFLQPL